MSGVGDEEIQEFIRQKTDPQEMIQTAKNMEKTLSMCEDRIHVQT